MAKHTRRPASKYLALLDRKLEEGLTYAELSNESGIPACTLQYWAKKSRVPSAAAPDDEASDAFLQVKLPAPTDAAIEVVLPGDIRVAVRPGFDAATLRAVVDMLAC